MNMLDPLPHLDALRRYARVLTRADGDADDLVQGALLRAYEKRASFREGGDLRVWLMAILHNHFIDQMRAQRAAVARDTAWSETQIGFAMPEGEHVVRLSQLRRAFLELPAEQREVLHLIAVEGMGVAEVAAVLSIPAGTVMSRVGRARAALRKFEEEPQARSIPVALKLVRGHDDT